MTPSSALHALSPGYPYALRELKHPPPVLYVAGTLPDRPGVAIVGTRRATSPACRYTRKLTHELAKRGLSIWSGGAVGIDAAAHRAALEVNAPTVVVVGHGMNHCFPREHRDLFEDIVAKGGAVVSPFDLDDAPQRFRFPERNIVLAALTRAMILVQAPVRSGGRSAAGSARRLGRALFVAPAWPWDRRGAGNLLDLRLGGRLLLDAREVADLALGLRPSEAPEKDPAPRVATQLSSTLGGACKSVFLAAESEPLHIDDLCERTGLSAAVVHEALLTLTLHAVLVEGPAGCFRRVSR